MTRTLLKHEIKRTWRWLALLCLGAALVVGVGVGSAFLLPAPLSPLLAWLAVVASFALPFAVQLLMGLDFYRSTYSKTGYLTMAIPVRGATIFWVKFGYAAVVSIVTALVGLGLAALAGLGMTRALSGSTVGYWEGLRTGWDLLVSNTPTWLLVVGAVWAVLLPVAGLVQHYFAAAVGSEPTFSRMGFGGVVLVWFLYYVALQLVTLVGIFLPLHLRLDGSGPRWSFNPLEVFREQGSSGLIPLGALLLALGFAAVAAWRAKVSVDKLVELR